jgi:uncharacterized protein
MSYPKQPDVETRFLRPAELRAEDGEGKLPLIVGYAAVFDSLSEDLGGFRERIHRDAFTRTLQAGADVRALVDHEPSRILGRSKAGTLRLRADAHGLRVEIDPPNTSAGRDIIESIRRGDVDGMSFAFRTPRGGDDWRMEDGGPTRTILDLDLLDVSAVTYPAYLQTDLSLRHLGACRRLRASCVSAHHVRKQDLAEWL